MREYLFRAKRKDNGEWVEGFFTYHLVDHLYIARIERSTGNEYGEPVDYITVDEKTVGQFSGITDKHGKKIFEGDLLKIRVPRNPNFSAVREIVFKDGQYIALDKDGGESEFACLSDIEVVGNIYDNPEKYVGTRYDND